MKLSQLIKNLQKLESVAGDMQVYARHGASGACYEMGTPNITSDVNDLGPFDLKPGEKYVSVYVGN